MPSSPLPPAARGPRRLHPPHPSRPLTGRAGGASAPHPLPGRRGTGRGRGVRGFCSFPSGPQPRAAAAPAPPLPHTPSRPCLPAGDLGRRRRRTDRAGRQLSVRSPAGREGVRGGAERKGGGHSAPPGRGELCREAKKEVPSPFPARMRSSTGWPRPLWSRPATPKPGLGSPTGPEAECVARTNDVINMRTSVRGGVEGETAPALLHSLEGDQ